MITCDFWENKIAGKIDAQVSNPEDMRREGRRGWGATSMCHECACILLAFMRSRVSGLWLINKRVVVDKGMGNGDENGSNVAVLILSPLIKLVTTTMPTASQNTYPLHWFLRGELQK